MPRAAAPESEVLRRGQSGLQGIEMAEEGQAPAMVLRLLGDRRTGPEKLAPDGTQQPRHQAQQARLAAAVGTAQQEHAAGSEVEIEMLEDEPLAPPAEQVAAGEGGGGEVLGHG
jgi:hypothetical protein